MRLVICCSHALLREGLRQLLRQWNGVQVVATVPDALDGARAAVRQRADAIVLVCGRKPGAEARAVAALRAAGRSCKVVVVEGTTRDSGLAELRPEARVGHTVGARGLVRVLLQTCDESAPAANGPLSSSAPGRPRPPTPQALLTRRQADVVRLVCAGMGNKVIARELRIAEKTVKNHLYSVYQRTGLTGRTQLAMWATRNGLFETRA
jgi:DNA-binding NarL/FixJ family response regulator